MMSAVEGLDGGFGSWEAFGPYEESHLVSDGLAESWCILDVDMAVSDTLSAEEGLDEVLGSISVNGS